MTKWPKKPRMHHGWGCCSLHRLSFFTEVENESVLLIALKIFIHLYWRQQNWQEGFRVLFYKQERWFQPWWTELTKSSCRRRGFVVKLVKKKKKNLGKVLLVCVAMVRGCWTFLVWLPDAVATCVILYISTFWSFEVSLRDKSDWAATLKYNDIFLDCYWFLFRGKRVKAMLQKVPLLFGTISCHNNGDVFSHHLHGKVTYD